MDDIKLHRFARNILVLLAAMLVACTSRNGPAPLTVLDNQVDASPSVFEQEAYTVKAGDTLFAIAWYSGNDYRDLAKWNGISKPYMLQIGQQITLKRPENRSRIVTYERLPTKKTGKNRVASSEKQAYSGEKVGSESPKQSPKPVSANDFPLRVNRWVWPAEGKIIGRFKQTGDVNKGIDVQAPLGTPIKAAAEGRVVYTGNALRGYGNLIIVKHTDTLLSAYAHNEKIMVQERQWISAGEQIATMGSSGTNTVKLHFEVRYRGKSLDPLRYLPK